MNEDLAGAPVMTLTRGEWEAERAIADEVHGVLPQARTGGATDG